MLPDCKMKLSIPTVGTIYFTNNFHEERSGVFIEERSIKAYIFGLDSRSKQDSLVGFPTEIIFRRESI